MGLTKILTITMSHCWRANSIRLGVALMQGPHGRHQTEPFGAATGKELAQLVGICHELESHCRPQRSVPTSIADTISVPPVLSPGPERRVESPLGRLFLFRRHKQFDLRVGAQLLNLVQANVSGKPSRSSENSVAASVPPGWAGSADTLIIAGTAPLPRGHRAGESRVRCVSSPVRPV